MSSPNQSNFSFSFRLKQIIQNGSLLLKDGRLHHVCQVSESQDPGQSSDEPAQSWARSSEHSSDNAYGQEMQKGHEEDSKGNSEEAQDKERSQEANGEVEFEETL